MSKTKLKTKIVQDPKDPVTTELLASSIRDVAAGMRALKASPLSERALFVLLKDSSGVSLEQIKRVMNALHSLERNYLR